MCGSTCPEMVNTGISQMGNLTITEKKSSQL
jgi:hypothetical protein